MRSRNVSAFHALTTATLLAFAIPSASAGDVSPRPAQAPAVAAPKVGQKDLLWWLPSDTESVVAARGPFPFPPAVPEKDEDERWFTKPATPTDIRLNLERLSLELFDELDDVTARLRGTTVAFAMQGTRHFREPLPGFDVMDFEGCSIVVFQDKLGDLGDTLLKVLEKKATRTETIAGKRVLVFHEKSGAAEWDHFFAIPQPDVMLAAHNLAYLQEVLERMAQKKNPRAFPDDLPEWQFLDPAVRFWGLRHYDPSQAKEDATSPFSDDKVFGPHDKQAVGMLFTLDPSNSRNAVVTQITGDEAGVKDAAALQSRVREPQAGVKFTVKLRSPAPGVLQVLYTLDKTSTLDYFLLDMQLALGRGMFF